MTPTDLDWALALAREEGWNPGLDDAPAFLAADPDGFFVADVGGTPAAVISVVNHDPNTAFLGLYICRPDLRGQGIGFALWTHALAHAGRRTVGLDGVADQEANYAKSGFVLTGRTHRYEGNVPGQVSSGIRSAASDDASALALLEAKASGFAKDQFMSLWTHDTPTRKTMVLDDGSGPTGFATIRACHSGHKIGPLVAQSGEDAIRLLHAAAGQATGPVIIDIPDDNASLADHCTTLGMTVGFSTARMYRGTPPTPGTPHRTVATLELG